MDAGRGPDAVLSRITVVAETGSTNADLLGAAGQVADGAWLVAEQQLAGRGREGRAWASPAGNLYASTLLRLRPGDPPAPGIALVAAVALHATLTRWLPEPSALRLKWPNDLLLDGAKLAGILLERQADAVVAGFGVNLAHHPAGLDRAVTHLGEHAVAPAPLAVVEVLAGALDAWLVRWRAEGLAPVRDAWLARAHALGTTLSAALPEGGRGEGVFDGLADDGALRLRLADGTVRVIHAGDVFLL